MDLQVVRCQRVSIFKHKHVALSLVTDVMVLFVVLSQHLCVSKNFKLGQVVRLPRDLAHATALPPTHVAEEVLLPVVKVQLVNVVEKLVLTEKTPGMLLCYVALEGVVLVKCVLEHESRLEVEAVLAEVNVVNRHVVVPQLSH